MNLTHAVTVERITTATPQQVWAILADGWAYATWVVGAARVRAVERDWPRPGQKIHHSFGTWPALLNDTTEVLAATEPESMMLKTRGWPAGEAEVVISVEARSSGTAIRIQEDAVAGPGKLICKALRQMAIGPRNHEALRRLAYMAEAHTRDPQ